MMKHIKGQGNRYVVIITLLFSSLIYQMYQRYKEGKRTKESKNKKIKIKIKTKIRK